MLIFHIMFAVNVNQMVLDANKHQKSLFFIIVFFWMNPFIKPKRRIWYQAWLIFRIFVKLSFDLYQLPDQRSTSAFMINCGLSRISFKIFDCWIQLPSVRNCSFVSNNNRVPVIRKNRKSLREPVVSSMYLNGGHCCRPTYCRK